MWIFFGNFVSDFDKIVNRKSSNRKWIYVQGNRQDMRLDVA